MMHPESTHPTTAELLAEASWAKALAYRLVGDAAAADDVVQEALLAAVRRPPRGEALRPWFARVVTNAARMGRRREARRDRRERRAARQEGLPSAGELVAKAEAQRTLVDAVLRLDEPYRATVLLRYFEDLSSAEIARRQGVPAATVRWRLAESLKKLRQQLDAEFGGDARTWCAALLPLVDQKARAALGLGASSLTSIGVMLMSTKSILLLGTAGLLWFLAYAVGILPGSDADAVPESPAPEPVAFRPLAEPEPPRAADEVRKAIEPGKEDTPPAQSPRLEVVVRARFVDADGSPIANARLATAKWMRSRGAPAASASSDSTGTVELRWQIAETEFGGGAGIAAEFVASRWGFANERREAVVRRDRELDLGEIVLRPGGAIAGRVVDGHGHPLEGCEVSVAAPARKRRLAGGIISSAQGLRGGDRALSDSGGRFRLSGLSPGFVRVDARFGGLRGRSGPVEVRAGMESHDLVLVVLRERPRDSTITGLVLDPEDKPVPRASLRYTYRGFMRKGSGSVIVGHDGRFEIEDVKKGDYTLLASDSRERFGDVEKGGVAPGDFVILRLPPARRFAVELSDAGGRPVVEATIGVRSAGAATNPLQYLPAVRSDDGVYGLRLPSIAFRLVLSAPGFEEKEFGPYDPASLRGEPPRIQLSLARAPVLAGRASMGGRPAANVEVGLYRRAEQRTLKDGFPVWLHDRPVVRARTGSDGRFVLTMREPGTYFVRAQHNGFAISEIGPLTERDVHREIAIALDAGGRIRGRVRSARGRSPAGTVVGISRGDGAARTQRVGADGTFEFEHLTPGRWMVRQCETEILPGNTSSTSSQDAPYHEVPTVCEVFAGQVTEYDVWIDTDEGSRPRGQLRGQFRLGDLDLAGWKFELLPVADTGAEIAIASGRLDREGRFTAQLKSVGEHRLILFDDTVKGPFGRRLVAPVRLAPGTNGWELRLEGAGLRGTGAPRDAASALPVALLWEGRGEHAGTTYVHTITADAAGRFRLPVVPAGPCRLVRLRDSEEVAASGGRRGWVTLHELQLRRGTEVAVDLTK